MTYRFDADTLYNLLPAVYRTRDAALAQDPEKGGPLRQYIEVLAKQAMVVEENIWQLYDDQFIETAAEWVVPYIGDLIGTRLIEMPDDEDVNFSQRAQVANTIATRRRKGTAAILEQVANDVMGMPARVVEYFNLVATTQHLNHIRNQHIVFPDIHNQGQLEEVNTPFTTIPRTPDMHRIQNGSGKYNIPNIGIFIWRLTVYPLTRIQAYQVDDRRYMFNPLGIDTQLFNNPKREEQITDISQLINTPHPITRWRLLGNLGGYYGNAFTIYRNGTPVTEDEIQVCNLADTTGGDWTHEPDNQIGVDPVLGRIHFPTNVPAPDEVEVTFHLPYVLPMGGGEYATDRLPIDETRKASVNTDQELEDAIEEMRLPTSDGNDGIVEITDSNTYNYNPTSPVFIGADARLVIRAINGKRPVIQLQSSFMVQGASTGESELVLEGICFAGNSIQIMGRLDKVMIRHCTFVPGIQLNRDGTPQQPSDPSLIVRTTIPCTVTIEHSIIGGMRVNNDSTVNMTNSILDATDETEVAFEAHNATTTNRWGGSLELEACTIRGTVYTTELIKASNCIFVGDAPVDTPAFAVQQQQTGCIRFSYHPPLAKVQLPRRYRCIPNNDASTQEIHPIFTANQYGQAGYFQLTPDAPGAIRHGADDSEEMGVYHDVYQHLRERNLNYRLDEFLRFGLYAGVFYAT